MNVGLIVHYFVQKACSQENLKQIFKVYELLQHIQFYYIDL